jgi:hypothetical protein
MHCLHIMPRVSVVKASLSASSLSWPHSGPPANRVRSGLVRPHGLRPRSVPQSPSVPQFDVCPPLRALLRVLCSSPNVSYG